jgi:hypothetical protein
MARSAAPYIRREGTGKNVQRKIGSPLSFSVNMLTPAEPARHKVRARSAN